jgi:hypothetical protein
VTDWIDQFKVFWNNKLDALGDFLDNQQAEEQQYTGGAIKFPIKKKK